MPAALIDKKLQYDGHCDISIASHKRSTDWGRKNILWSEFLNKIQIPVVTRETMADYATMDNDKRSRAKDVGGYVGGVLEGALRKKDAVVSRSLITLDLDDSVEDPELLWEMFQLAFPNAAAIHTTHSHTPEKPRSRIIMPLSSPVSPVSYTKISEYIANTLGQAQFDKTTHQANRLMFWPSICRDGVYYFNYNDAPWLDVAPILKEMNATALMTLSIERNPASLPGTEGRFCKKYNVPEAISEFLSDIYIPVGEDRYRYVLSHSMGGLVLYENGNYAFSHHSKDPAEGTPRNAFELVRIHKFKFKYDENYGQVTQALSDEDSYKAMAAWCKEENVCEIVEWLDELVVDKKGIPSSTIDNIRVIMNNDPELADKYYYDEFADKVMVADNFPWIAFSDRVSFEWSDADDAGIRGFLETKYGMTENTKTNDAFWLAQLDKKHHPIREYFSGLKWDFTPRMETIFIKYLGAEDTPYVRSVTRKALIGAVARVLRPGCKHDHVLVLVGPQGCRKSQTIARLGKEWFSDSLNTMQGKEAYELLQGKWIIELSEMAATRKADIEQIKSFVSKQSDNYRAAYARRAVDRPRQCAFFGSTNDEEFLKDPTGNRRFWPVKVCKVIAPIYAELTRETIDQIWAEAIQAFMDGELWYLDEKMEEEAKVVQEEYTEKNAKTGELDEFLESLVPPGWTKFSLAQRRNHYNTLTDEPVKNGVKRDRICAAEIWREHLNGDPKEFGQKQSIEINNMLKKNPNWEATGVTTFGFYGKQRGFKRKEVQA